MLINLSKFLTLAAFCAAFLGDVGFAQICPQLFDTTDMETAFWKSGTSSQSYGYKLHSDFKIDQQRLRQEGFEIRGGHLIDITNRKLVGKIVVVEPSYVFEWAGKKTHKSWLKRGGIQSWEMKEIIESDGAAVLGQGFYVSMDLTDSQSYGASVSAFKIERPIVAIRGASEPYRSERKFIERLRRAGADAFINSTTWLAIFNAKILKKISVVNQEVLDAIGISETNFDELIGLRSLPGKKYYDLLKNLPDSHILHRITRHELSEVEQESIYEYFKNPRNRIKSAASHFFAAAQKVAAHKALQLVETINPENIKAALKIILDFELYTGTGFARKILSQLNERDGNPIYTNLLELFDLRAVSITEMESDINSEIPSLEKMKVAAIEWSDTKRQLDALQNKKVSQIIRIVQAKNGVEPVYRKHPAYMGSDIKPDLKYFLVDVEVARNLSSNPFLVIKKRERSDDSGLVDIYVEYASIKSYMRIQGHLSKNLRDQIKEIDTDKPNFNSRKIHKLNQQLLETLTDQVLARDSDQFVGQIFNKGPEEVTAMDTYRVFMSIHPFEDLNGRLGRVLYYTFSKSRELSIYDTLVLPIYDLDLLGKPTDQMKYLFIGHFLKSWVEQAESDAEFVKRSRKALKIFLETNSEVKNIFPELKEGTFHP